MNMSAIPPRRLEEARRKHVNEKRATYAVAPTEAPLSQNVQLEEKLLAILLYDGALLPLARQIFTFPDGARIRPLAADINQRCLDEMLARYDSGEIPEFETMYDAWVGDDLLKRTDERELLNKLRNLAFESESVLINREQLVKQWANRLKVHAIRRAAFDISTTAAGIARPSEEQAATGDPVEDLRNLSERIATLYMSAATRPGRFHIMTDEEAQAMKPARGILGDILFEDSVAFMYGPPGRWKSFIAVAWALSIATGRDWLGRKVEEGDVLYIAGEGVRGVGKRISAWKRRHGVTGKTRLHVLGVPLHLLDLAEVEELIATVRAILPTPKLIVIDTLARAMSGADENSTADANKAFEGASKIREAFSCCVLVIHHVGKDSTRGMRGSSAFLGNADTVMRIKGGEDKPRIECGEVIKIESEKPKDSDKFEDIALTTDREVWATDEGETVSSLVVMAADLADFKPVVPMLTDDHRAAMGVLANYHAGARASEWERATLAITNKSSATFYRIRDFLVKESFVDRLQSGFYLLTNKGRSVTLTNSHDTLTTVNERTIITLTPYIGSESDDS